MIRGKSRRFAHGERALRKGAALLLAVVLAFTTSFATATAAESGKAAGADGGFVGTDDYNLFFKRIDGHGTDVFQVIDNKTFRVATTNEEDTCALRSETPSGRKMWESGAGIVSEKPISFAQDWVISVSATCPKPILTGTMVSASSQLNIAFGDKQSLGTSFRIAGVYGWSWSPDAGYSCRAMSGTINNGTWSSTTAQQGLPESTSDDVTMVMSYDSAQDIATFETAGVTLTFPGVGASMGGRAFISIVGAINWTNETGTVDKNRPVGMEQNITFESMVLPHLNPSISDVTITDLNGNPIAKEDAVQPGTVVKVRCLVQNTHSQAGVEQFPMHLSLVTADTAYKTQGVEPFFDADHPMKVRDVGSSSWADLTSTAAAEFNTGEGIPLTLKGNTPVEVTYYARVNQTSNEAVVLGQALEEDFFHGIHREKTELLSKRTLKPGTGDDPDDPTLTPGKDYHYTRLPAANANGWNGIATSPVNVTFYGGADCDFDRFSVTGANGSALASLTDTANVWAQATDVDALAVEFQATNSTTGAVSSKGADTIRIDTQAPALSWDAGTSTLTASDTADAGSGKATSGVWKVRQAIQSREALPASTQTEWNFALAGGKGAPTQTVASPAPGFYVAEDAAGNVSAACEVTGTSKPDPEPNDPDKPDTPGDPDVPAYPTITPKPDPSDPTAPAPKPLAPTQVTTDPPTNTTHAVVEDTLRQPLSETPITPSMMAGLISERYVAKSSLADGNVAAGAVSLFSSDGTPVDAIDRARPGTWYAEQTFTDSAGNSTTIRLTVIIGDGTSAGPLVTDTGGGTASAGPESGGDSHRTALANRIARLPQTGGILGPCPLHVLFALMAVMASAYALMRLRQRRSGDRRRKRAECAASTHVEWNEWEHLGSAPAEAAGQAPVPAQRGIGEQGRLQGLAPFDIFVLGTLAACAIALALLGFCPLDALLAALVVLLCALWAACLHRRASVFKSRSPRREPDIP